MKKILFTALLAISATVAAFAGEKDDTLKIMSYNLRFGELATMKQIGEYIASEAPDIVALQECDWDTAPGPLTRTGSSSSMNWRTTAGCSACTENPSIMPEGIMELAYSAAIPYFAAKECCFRMTEKASREACSLQTLNSLPGKS